MCYVYNQWYDISCATLYILLTLYTKSYSHTRVRGFHLHGYYNVVQVDAIAPINHADADIRFLRRHHPTR